MNPPLDLAFYQSFYPNTLALIRGLSREQRLDRLDKAKVNIMRAALHGQTPMPYDHILVLLERERDPR